MDFFLINMLIHFSDSEASLQNADPASLEVAISELLRSSRLGHHMVIVDRGTCRWLADNIDMTKTMRAHLRDLEMAYTQRKSLLKGSPFHLEVGVGVVPLEEIRPSHYRIGHYSLIRTRILDKSVLLVENSDTDGKLVRGILEALATRHSVRHFEFECLMGGGSTIVNAFEDALSENKAVSVVVDNDKSFPGAAPSSTMKSLTLKANNARFAGFVQDLPCRDVENLIPLDLIRDANVRPDYPNSWLEFLQNLVIPSSSQHMSCCPLLFFDMKNGISVEKVSKKSAASAERIWVEQVFSIDGELKDVPGFGDAIVADVMKSRTGMRALSESVRGKEWQAKFGALFDRLLWQMVADRRKAL